MKAILKRPALSAAALLLAIGAETRARAGLIVSVDNPGVQSSTVAGATTETFDGSSPGTYSSLNTAVGTVTSASGGKFAIVQADIFGGAGGSGNYFSVGAQSGSAAPATLTLNGPQAYFGFWWSAGDFLNQVSFYSGNQLLGSFNTQFVFNALESLPNGSQYFDNPNNGGAPGQAFAYMNFIGTNGTTITSVVFENSGSTASGFESDNWSISPTAPNPIPGTIIVGGISTPEPSSLTLAGIAGALGCLAYLRRRSGMAQQ
jgi:PEP-CTERM motif